MNGQVHGFCRRGEKHPLYDVWDGMKKRCYNPKHIHYPLYGGRGIRVCGRWLDRKEGLRNFINDMGERPEGYTLDRVDNDGDYTPENCKWSSYLEQVHNRGGDRRNTSGRKGVHYFKNRDKWWATITYNKVRHYLGSFETYEEACLARDSAEKELIRGN